MLVAMMKIFLYKGMYYCHIRFKQEQNNSNKRLVLQAFVFLLEKKGGVEGSIQTEV